MNSTNVFLRFFLIWINLKPLLMTDTEIGPFNGHIYSSRKVDSKKFH